MMVLGKQKTKQKQNKQINKVIIIKKNCTCKEEHGSGPCTYIIYST